MPSSSSSSSSRNSPEIFPSSFDSSSYNNHNKSTTMPNQQQQHQNTPPISLIMTKLSSSANNNSTNLSSSLSSANSSRTGTGTNSTPISFSPEFGTTPSPTFNRWPLSDTPDGSYANSPRELPLSAPYNFGGSGSESLKTTPPSSGLNLHSDHTQNHNNASSSATSSSSTTTTTTTTSSNLHKNLSNDHLSLETVHEAPTLTVKPPTNDSPSLSKTPVLDAVSEEYKPSVVTSTTTTITETTNEPSKSSLPVKSTAQFSISPGASPSSEPVSTTPKVAPAKVTTTKKTITTTTTSIPPLNLPSRRATTLDVPGLTRSRVSPNGAISQQDVGSKLVIVMVGLPARGKSYVTNKLCRYLNWQQHNARIFNVGNTRRKASQNPGPASVPLPDKGPHTKVWSQPPSISEESAASSPKNSPVNNNNAATSSTDDAASSASLSDQSSSKQPSTDSNHNNVKPKVNTEQTAEFFSPDNPESFAIREKWAMDTLDELLEYVIDGPGSVGILDATNTTRARRKKVINRIKERSDGRLKVLYLESICTDNDIIEQNIRLKLSGPDYKDCDQEVALKDFVGRMRNYEKVYETISEDEDDSGEDFQYIKMIDVGKKVVCYNIKGFLAGQVVFFLLNFNLAERQIWITRHGESVDNANGRIGGDAPLTARGEKFAKTLAKFMEYQKNQFRKQQLERWAQREHFLNSRNNSTTNSDDEAATDTKAETLKPPKKKAKETEPEEPHFCVWTSMLRRSIDTAKHFDEDIFDIKEMRMLNELGAGICDGMTYPEIKIKYPQEYQARMSNKIEYRYPGLGGESYLDVINRIRPVIVEVERMTDNALIIAHRVVCRILLAYFMNLGRDSIGDLDVPLHTLYCLEPKPYGVAWEAYEYDDKTDWFYRVPKETMLERHRRPSTAPQLSGRSRQYSVMPTSPEAAVPPGGFHASGTNNLPSVFSSPASSYTSAVTPGSSLGGPGFAAQRGMNNQSSSVSSSLASARQSSNSNLKSMMSSMAQNRIPNSSSLSKSIPIGSRLEGPFGGQPAMSELSARLSKLNIEKK